MKHKQLNSLFNKYCENFGFPFNVSFNVGKYYELLPDIVMGNRLKERGVIISRGNFALFVSNIKKALLPSQLKITELKIKDGVKVEDISINKDCGFIVFFDHTLIREAKILADRINALLIYIPIGIGENPLKNNDYFIQEDCVKNYTYNSDMEIIIDDKLPLSSNLADIYASVMSSVSEIADFLIHPLKKEQKIIVALLIKEISSVYKIYKAPKDKITENLMTSYFKCQMFLAFLKSDLNLYTSLDAYSFIKKDFSPKDALFFTYKTLIIYKEFFVMENSVRELFPAIPDLNLRSEKLSEILGTDEKFILENLLQQTDEFRKVSPDRNLLGFIKNLESKKEVLRSTYNSLGGTSLDKFDRRIKYAGDLFGISVLGYIRGFGFTENL